MNIDNLLFEKADVYVIINLTDDYGNTFSTKNIKYSDIKVRKNLKNVSKTLTNGKIKVFPNIWKMFLYDDISINESNLIVLNGIYYDILNIYKVFNSSIYHHSELIVKLFDSFVDPEYWLTEQNNIFSAESGYPFTLED